MQVLLRTIGTQCWSYLLLTTFSSTHNNTLQILPRTIGTQCWSYLLLTVHVQVHTTHCRFYWEQLGPSAGVIYSWLYMFKYTQHTAGFTENNWDPALELSTLDYMFMYTQQHTAGFTENNWDPVLELSTLDCTCSSTHNTLQILLRTIGTHCWNYLLLAVHVQVHNNTLQILLRTIGTQCWSYLLLTVHVQVHITHCRFLQRTIGTQRWSYLLLAVHVQVHTTHCRFYWKQLEPSTGVIYSWLYMFKYTQHPADFTENNWDPALELSTLGCTCSSTHNTLQILLRTIGTQCWSYLLSAVHVQVHTTHCRFYWEQLGPSRWSYLLLAVHLQVHTTHCRFYWKQLGPSAGVIYSWLYMFKYTQHTADFTENNWDPTLELSTLGCTCSSTHNTLQILLKTIGTQHWSYLLLTVHVQVHTTHCRFYWEQLGSSTGVIYSWLYMFKYTKHTADFTENNWDPAAGVIYSWLYMFKYTQHTADFTENNWDPALKLSTLGCTCSSTHNTLQILLRTIGTQRWSYLLLAVHVQVDTTQCRFYWEQLGPSAGVIYSWLYMFKYTQHTADFTENNWDPALELSTLDCTCSSTHNNTLQILLRTGFGPAPPKTGPSVNFTHTQ
jgi:hypothetical protein